MQALHCREDTPEVLKVQRKAIMDEMELARADQLHDMDRQTSVAGEDRLGLTMIREEAEVEAPGNDMVSNKCET